MVVVSALRLKDSCSRAFRQVLDDIKDSFTHFSSVEVLHVYADVNRVAHILAMFALT
jgi:hypothetical protein